MQPKYIDIHSHLNLTPLWEKKEEVIEKMRELGVGTITVGTDLETSKRAIQTVEEFPDVVIGATVGIHPNDVIEGFDQMALAELAKNKSVVAIGECGLDYFRTTDQELQKNQRTLFEWHIRLACELTKPLMIHARPSKGSMDAYEEVLFLLKDFPNVRANFHFFVGDTTVAKKIIERGDTMSFDGPITFSQDYDEVIRYIPIENIMTETDAPYAAPVPYRGKVCEPWMVTEVYKKIAEIKNLPDDVTVEQINKNVAIFAKQKYL